ncbi:hypothetical protein B0J14DRAFT_627421 [Halenospora varia]|nr:hypothetical protein B0J14DRAFT_627421 [Halenospora varia]
MGHSLSSHQPLLHRHRAHHLHLPPGTVYKVEQAASTSLFSLPPATSLSRFIYQSQDLNGTKIPVSAYILWPHTPRTMPDEKFQVGYVVVATDYAGLGVSRNGFDAPIVHQYPASPSHANDVSYSMQAGQNAFLGLSKEFVVVGHSQVVEPVEGYLGAVVIAPVTKILEQPEPILTLLSCAIAAEIADLLPDFKVEEILTEEGVQRMKMYQELGGCTASMISLLTGYNLLKPEQQIFQVEYIRDPGVEHTGAVTATQWMWMEWVGERFAGKAVEIGLVRREVKVARHLEDYQDKMNWFLGGATEFWHTP